MCPRLRHFALLDRTGKCRYLITASGQRRSGLRKSLLAASASVSQIGIRPANMLQILAKLSVTFVGERDVPLGGLQGISSSMILGLRLIKFANTLAPISTEVF